MNKYYWLFCLLCFSCMKTPQEETGAVQIKVLEKANNGNPFYVVIKNTDYLQFLKDDYQDIVEKALLGKESAEDILLKVCLIPGTTQTIPFAFSKNKSIGIYCLFTTPKDDWKCYVEKEQAHFVKLLLDESEIRSNNQFY